MILLKWKVARYVVIGGVLVGFIWLAYWVVPTLGFFNLAASDSPFTENGVSMVFFKDGKASSAYSMNKVTFGWSLIREAWPLALLGVMLGCPFGEILRRQVAVEQLSESAKKKQMDRSIDF
jgi:hypothetical protein